MFSSERHFVVFSYEAAHGLLLLRSPKGRHGARTRIDVLFQDVRAIELRLYTKGLAIHEIDPSHLADAPSNPTELIEPGNRVYQLVGDGWRGFVVGGILSTVEDDGEETGSSPLADQCPDGRALAESQRR
jgi:hypothetical protein